MPPRKVAQPTQAICALLKATPGPVNALSSTRVSRVEASPEEGRNEHILLLELTDVTRRSRISRENALLTQHGAGRQMIRQLAHEIKNPLGGLRGAAQLLARELHDASLAEYTDVIISEADRLASLVDTLLGPGGPLKKSLVNLHELLEYVIRLQESAAGEKVSFHRDYDPGLPAANVDRDPPRASTSEPRPQRL